jgi:hypothetical protein
LRVTIPGSYNVLLWNDVIFGYVFVYDVDFIHSPLHGMEEVLPTCTYFRY